MTNVDLDATEAALLRSLIFTAAATQLLAGPNDEVYEITPEGFDVLLTIRNKLEEIPLPA